MKPEIVGAKPSKQSDTTLVPDYLEVQARIEDANSNLVAPAQSSDKNVQATVQQLKQNVKGLMDNISKELRCASVYVYMRAFICL